jgi:hypothetical protein
VGTGQVGTGNLCLVREGHLKRMQLRATKSTTQPDIAMKSSSVKPQMLDTLFSVDSLGQAKLNGMRAGSEGELAMLGHVSWGPTRYHHDGSQL